ncbi:hypothetical protein VULLAG_LOCUS10306 [Vulpes lagopus]
MPADCAASGRPAAGRARRVAPLGTGSTAMQPGRSAAPAAPRTEPAAARSPQPGSGPAGASKPGLEHWSGAAAGRGGGGGRRGRAAPRRARGPPPAQGIPPGVARGSPGEGVGAVGGEASHRPARSPGTGSGVRNPERIGAPDPGSPRPASLRTGGPGGAQGCGDPGAAPACRERPGAGGPGQVRLQSSPLPHPAPLPASRQCSEAVSVLRCATAPRRGRELRESARTRVLRHRRSAGQTRGHPQSQPCSLVDPGVTQDFSNPLAPFA